MFIPQIYPAALALMILSMACWGSWGNTQKATGSWRFELFYWDYVWGILLLSLTVGLTFGRTDPASPESFWHNLASAGARSLLLALAGGVIFNIGNMLLVAAIGIAGLAVAFPIGIGLALVIGSVLNYVVTPAGNPLLLFGGIGLVCVAIVLDALAYRNLSADVQVTTKGIVLSLLAGVGIGVFYPFIAKAIKGEGHLGPYTVMFVFALGILISNLPVNYALMRRPITGAPPVSLREYFAARGGLHAWGVLGGLIWGVGTVSNFVASYAQMVGPAASYALGQGATMVSALWGVFVWKEFRGAGPASKRFLTLMFVFFIMGLAGIALAPVVK
ncbi:MAG: GRP family sugar transporter [Terriglobia bacterium]